MEKKDNRQKPLVYMVTWFCCIRVIKETYVLKKRGYPLKIITQNLPSILSDLFSPDEIVPFFSAGTKYEESFNWRFQIKSRVLLHTRLKHVLRSLPKADIYHIHNEPSDLVNSTREAVPDAKIIFDVHDLDYMRDRIVRDYETCAFKAADGVVWQSRTYGDIAGRAYKFSGPSTYVLLAVPKDWYQNPKSGTGIVYQGGALPPDALKERPNLAYRDMTRIVESFRKKGYDIHMYIPDIRALEYYRSIGAKVEPTLTYLPLLSALSGYAWGLSLFDSNSEQIKMNMPNKLFDYMAAGIPIIANKHTAFGDFIESTGIGITVDIDEIPTLPDPTPYKQKVMKIRDEYTMDREVDKIEDLYRHVISG